MQKYEKLMGSAFLWLPRR